jgi:conjugal transfer pilus assembly protein TraF
MSIAGSAIRALMAFAAALACGAAFAQPLPKSASISAACHAGTGYWCDSWRGWHFYEDPQPEAPPPKDTPPAPPPPAETTARAPELLQLERLQNQLEEVRGIAIINPTEANVRRYMELEARVYAQASRFSEVAQRVGWSSPEFDPTLQGRPVNARALEVFERTQFEARQRAVAALARDHALLFFFRSDCPYCHAFAPILASFRARYGIRIVAVSVDGGGLAEFPDFRRDNGIATTLNVTQVPALFIAQPFAGRITALGFGVLSDGELLERIAAVTAPGAETILPSAPARTASR